MIHSGMHLGEIATVLREDVVHLQRYVAGRYADLERRQRRGGKGVMIQCGAYTSPDEVQWLYVVTISPVRTSLYPMAWYFDSEGIHGVQIDAEGPMTHLRPHVLDQYRARFCPTVDVQAALQQLHWENYDKASVPRTYKGAPSIASAVEHGFLLGVMVYSDTVVDMHTFFDVEMGMQHGSLRSMRQLLEWRRYYVAMAPKVISTETDRYKSWGLGFPLRLERLKKAA
ncbi:MAG: hypothetical protein ABIY71_03485 [Flavobacteriales bacterium]